LCGNSLQHLLRMTGAAATNESDETKHRRCREENGGWLRRSESGGADLEVAIVAVVPGQEQHSPDIPGRIAGADEEQVRGLIGGVAIDDVRAKNAAIGVK